MSNLENLKIETSSNLHCTNMVINLKAYYSVYQYIHVILVLSHMPTLYAIYEAAVHQLRNMDAVAC
jgi:hypothetical protein